MDEIDKKLISILQKDITLPLSDIAKRTGISKTPCWNRIRKMEEENIIKLILLGLVSILILQTFVHIGVNIRILPTTGMAMPFLSYGGSSIISNSILAGIILNLTRRKI